MIFFTMKRLFVPLVLYLGLFTSLGAVSTYVTTSGNTENIINTQTGELHEWPATLTPGVNANGYEMHYADLRNADLSNASLQETEFTNADLRFADLSGANLWRARLDYADLRFADLTGAIIGQVNNWQGALLYGATFDPEWDESFFITRGADLTTVPEPSTYALAAGIVVLALALYQRRKRP